MVSEYAFQGFLIGFLHKHVAGVYHLLRTTLPVEVGSVSRFHGISPCFLVVGMIGSRCKPTALLKIRALI